jgi:hypothetical protein
MSVAKQHYLMWWIERMNRKDYQIPPQVVVMKRTIFLQLLRVNIPYNFFTLVHMNITSNSYLGVKRMGVMKNIIDTLAWTINTTPCVLCSCGY